MKKPEFTSATYTRDHLLPILNQAIFKLANQISDIEYLIDLEISKKAREYHRAHNQYSASWWHGLFNNPINFEDALENCRKGCGDFQCSHISWIEKVINILLLEDPRCHFSYSRTLTWQHNLSRKRATLAALRDIQHLVKNSQPDSVIYVSREDAKKIFS